MVAENVTHKRRAHVLLMPADGHGHFYPPLQFIYHLSTPRYVNDVIVTVVNGECRSGELAKLKEKGDFGNLDLRLEPMDSFSPVVVSQDKPSPATFSLSVQKSFKSYRERIIENKDNGERLTCIIGDMFFWWLVDLAEELKIPFYPVYPAPSWYMCACLSIENPLVWSRDPDVKSEKVPGLDFSRVFDYPEDILNYPEFFAAKNERLLRAKTVLVNVVDEWDTPTGSLDQVRAYLESKATLENQQAPRVLTVGPIVAIDGFAIGSTSQLVETARTNCLQWMDNQLATSVLYIAFGTLLNISPDDMLELAHSLEACGVHFLWVLKVPAGQTLASILPPDFESRTAERGFIETGFVPQTEILKHPSIAAFMTHCGWNSIMESLCAGVPLITWPVSLDQPLNARFLVNVWKAGVGVKAPEVGYRSKVTREEIEKAITALMIDEEKKGEVRENVKKLKSLAEAAVAEGGSSYQNMHSFLEEITHPLSSTD